MFPHRLAFQSFLLTNHKGRRFWVPLSKKDQTPLKLTPGKRTIRVSLNALDKNLMSNPITIRVGPSEKTASDNKTSKSNKGSEIVEETPFVREGNLSWRRIGKEKHVWVTEATDEDLAELAKQSDITSLNLMDGRPDGLGFGNNTKHRSENNCPILVEFSGWHAHGFA